jgi:hypothetical protein
VSWDIPPSDEGVTSYDVFRSFGGGALAYYTSVSVSSLQEYSEGIWEFLDEDFPEDRVVPGCYAVTAVAGSVPGSRSETVCTPSYPAAPSSPTGVVVYSDGCGNSGDVCVSWDVDQAIPAGSSYPPGPQQMITYYLLQRSEGGAALESWAHAEVTSLSTDGSRWTYVDVDALGAPFDPPLCYAVRAVADWEMGLQPSAWSAMACLP